MIALSNENLISAFRSLIKEERRITREILDHINEVSRRRLYADLGFSSLFEWLVKDLGYSESAAYRRMQAARILQAVPEAADKVESGVLNLSILSKVQTSIRADEKRTGERISPQEKSAILAKVESCSGREAEHQLTSHFPDLVNQTPKENIRAVSADQISMNVTFTREQFEKLKRIQGLLSHTHLGSSHAELLDAAMDVFLAKKDPLKKAVKARLPQGDTAAEVESAKSPVKVERSKCVAPATRNAVFKRSGGTCEYLDPNTGGRCESRHLLEIDHILPRALGGTNEPANLRTLCRTHNLLMAEHIFGRKKSRDFGVRLNRTQMQHRSEPFRSSG